MPKPDAIKRYLTTKTMARAAEMLAMPHLVCRRRDCRRRGRCAWSFQRSGEPCCLANLDAGQRRLFDEFAEQVAEALWVCSCVLRRPAISPYREDRALEDAAMEAIRPLIAPGRHERQFYRQMLRIRADAPPPRYDGNAPRDR